MKSYFTKKEQIVILIVIVLILGTLGFKFFSSSFIEKEKNKQEMQVNFTDDERSSNQKNEEIEDVENVNTLNLEEEPIGNIIVHVSGQVISPGIVELAGGERLIDAVEKLGGLTPQADGDRINLAKKLQDEEKIYIPRIGEELDLKLLEVVETSANLNNNSDQNKANIDKIDINLCTKEELNSLPGIGEVLSARILEYREENIFKAIEDIKNVSGIGNKKYEGLKDSIIVK